MKTNFYNNVFRFWYFNFIYWLNVGVYGNPTKTIFFRSQAINFGIKFSKISVYQNYNLILVRFKIWIIQITYMVIALIMLRHIFLFEHINQNFYQNAYCDCVGWNALNEIRFWKRFFAFYFWNMFIVAYQILKFYWILQCKIYSNHM